MLLCSNDRLAGGDTPLSDNDEYPEDREESMNNIYMYMYNAHVFHHVIMYMYNGLVNIIISLRTKCGLLNDIFKTYLHLQLLWSILV